MKVRWWGKTEHHLVLVVLCTCLNLSAIYYFVSEHKLKYEKRDRKGKQEPDS